MRRSQCYQRGAMDIASEQGLLHSLPNVEGDSLFDVGAAGPYYICDMKLMFVSQSGSQYTMNVRRVFTSFCLDGSGLNKCLQYRSAQGHHYYLSQRSSCFKCSEHTASCCTASIAYLLITLIRWNTFGVERLLIRESQQ